ncbi:MAG TPA: two-component regulator propeller domain-containing protein [Bryobacteraceae bacterium]|jgi:ligand-binding sensor domain-containing protein/two-component sensor histidine kinase
MSSYTGLWRRAIVLAWIAFAPGAFCERLPIRAYSAADGLGSNDINSITRDSRGFLWFATREGLSRFDGYEFVTYGRTHGLPRDHVSDFLETRSGAYWVTTPDGLAQFDPNAPAGRKFTVYRPQSVGGHQIYALYEDRAGQLWCGTEGGLFRLRAPDAAHRAWQFEPVPIALQSGRQPVDRRILSLFEDSRGNLWMGTFHALYRRAHDGRMFEYQSKPREGGDFLWNTIFEDRKGRLWAGTGFGLWRLRPQGANDYRPEPVFVPKQRLIVWCMLEDSAGKLWLGTSGGLIEWNADRDRTQLLRMYTEANGLTHDDITALGLDREGNLWLGSGGGGAMRVAQHGFLTYTAADRIGLGQFTGVNGTLFRDRAGEVHIAFHHVIHALRGEKFVSITPAIPKPHSRYLGWGWHQTIVQDKTGEWWIPTAEGLVRFPSVSIEELSRTRPRAVYTTHDGLGTNDIFRVFEDSRGGIWMACIGLAGVNGLSRWDRRTNSFHHYSEHGFTVATAFAEDADGSIWIGYYDGALARFANGSFRFYGVNDGLAGGGVQALHIDRSGRLWIASLRGLTRVDSPGEEHPRFIRFGTREGLSSNVVLCITEDRWGRVYLATGRGIDRIDATGQIAPARVKHYTEVDGLTKGDLRDVLFDKDGFLWCASKQGISRFAPEPDSPHAPPPMFIREVRVRGVPLTGAGEAAIPPLTFRSDQNQLQIDFSGLAFTPSEALQYQYRLEPADRDWSEASPERTVNYSNLAPGQYRFLARAVTGSGVVSDHPASFRFTVLSPVWQRLWFRLLLFSAILSALSVMFHYRTRRALELERMRTRIAMDLHDDIGSGLSQIAVLTEVARARAGASGGRTETAMLSKIASVSRELSESMGDIVWSVDPGRDRLRDLLQRMRRFASDLLSGSNIEFRFDVTAREQDIHIAPGMRREIYLVFKEALNNVVRHSGCSCAEIAISVDNSWLELKVQDNGNGLNRNSNEGGHGIASMRERTQRIGGQFQLEPGKLGGLLITVRVPT